MIKKYALIPLQSAMNQALNLDPLMTEKLHAFEGKVLHIHILPLSIDFFMQFHEGKIVLLDTYEGVADTVIKSSPLGLIRLSCLPASQARSLFNDSIDISGDVELGTRIKQMVDEMDIDWEGHLAHFTGDAVAHQLGAFVRQSFSFAKSVQQSFSRNLSGYLQEEIRLFPPREEMQDFFNDVDTLALQVERIDAHVHLLLADHETN